MRKNNNLLYYYFVVVFSRILHYAAKINLLAFVLYAKHIC